MKKLRLISVLFVQGQHPNETAHLYVIQRKFIEGSSEKVNRINILKKNNVALKIFHCHNVSVVFKCLQA
jgi:hypothetical protein